MIYKEIKSWFVSVDYTDTKITLQSIQEIVKALNVKLNMHDVETCLRGLNDNSIAMLKSETKCKDSKGKEFLSWAWYDREDFIEDVLTYIGMKAKSKTFIYYESDDFIQGYKFVVIA